MTLRQLLETINNVVEELGEYVLDLDVCIITDAGGTRELKALELSDHDAEWELS